MRKLCVAMRNDMKATSSEQHLKRKLHSTCFHACACARAIAMASFAPSDWQTDAQPATACAAAMQLRLRCRTLQPQRAHQARGAAANADLCNHMRSLLPCRVCVATRQQCSEPSGGTERVSRSICSCRGWSWDKAYGVRLQADFCHWQHRQRIHLRHRRALTCLRSCGSEHTSMSQLCLCVVLFSCMLPLVHFTATVS
jgi:hypothetical protein